MPETINQDGEPLVWVAKYWRYHSPYEAEFDSMEEAARFLENGEDAGDLSSEAIIAPDGTVFHNYQIGDIDDRTWTVDEAEV